MTDRYQRALDGATALLEQVGAGASWAGVCAVVADCLNCTTWWYAERVSGYGPSLWMPADHDTLPAGRGAGDPQHRHGRPCPRGAGRHLAMPVSETGVLVGCRAAGRFDAADQETARHLLPLLRSVRRHAGRPDLPQLTPRELAVLHATAEGLTAATAGRRLDISSRTFEKHQQRLYRKLGTRDRVHTVLLAQQLGILPVSPATPLPGAATAR